MLVAVGCGLLLGLRCKEEAWLQLELFTFQQDALVREGRGLTSQDCSVSSFPQSFLLKLLSVSLLVLKKMPCIASSFWVCFLGLRCLHHRLEPAYIQHCDPVLHHEARDTKAVYRLAFDEQIRRLVI